MIPSPTRPTRPTRPARRSRALPPSLLTLCALALVAGRADAGAQAAVNRNTAARVSASTSASSRGAARRDDAYAVTRTQRDWVEVQFGRGKAWLKRADVTVGEGAVKRVTASSGMNVRSGAGAKYRRLGSLPSGAHVVDQGGSSVWRKISFEGKTGYVFARFLRAVPGGGGGATTVGAAARIEGATSAPAPSRASTSGPTARMEAWDGGRRIGRVDVVRIDGEPVAVRTAEAYQRMREAARRDGVTLRINSGFRTYQEQAELYRLYRAGRGNLAARPGHSNHQDGQALDLNTATPGVLRWLNRNAARFGFRRTVRSEPWHWELRG